MTIETTIVSYENYLTTIQEGANTDVLWIYSGPMRQEAWLCIQAYLKKGIRLEEALYKTYRSLYQSQIMVLLARQYAEAP